tara:strand:+ start:280 stop:609 length:330 start_codon:yes stop_codon:yes gene_type:complete
MPKGSWKEFDQAQIRPTSVNLGQGSVPSKHNQKVRVQKTRTGRKGKIVTEIHGLDMPSHEAIQLLKTLKSSCGTGGTIKGNVLELQGDQVSIVISILIGNGYMPKQSGG